ncbi:MAG TPA: ATP-binding protein, partial [Geobacteraceae bacterium]
TLRQQRIECRLDLAAGLPMSYIDFRQTAYCLRAIITTIAEHHSEGGDIGIATGREDDRVVVRITDRDTVLSPQALEALTTPFITTQEMGIGVGLPLCRVILEKQGIPLSIDSPPGGGTIYSIRLPTTKEEGTDGQDSRS